MKRRKPSPSRKPSYKAPARELPGHELEVRDSVLLGLDGNWCGVRVVDGATPDDGRPFAIETSKYRTRIVNARIIAGAGTNMVGHHDCFWCDGLGVRRDGWVEKVRRRWQWRRLMSSAAKDRLVFGAMLTFYVAALIALFFITHISSHH